MPKLKFGDVTWMPFASLSARCACNARCVFGKSDYCPKSEIGRAIDFMQGDEEKARRHEFGVTKDGQVMGARRLADAPPR